MKFEDMINILMRHISHKYVIKIRFLSYFIRIIMLNRRQL